MIVGYLCNIYYIQLGWCLSLFYTADSKCTIHGVDLNWPAADKPIALIQYNLIQKLTYLK